MQLRIAFEVVIVYHRLPPGQPRKHLLCDLGGDMDLRSMVSCPLVNVQLEGRRNWGVALLDAKYRPKK